MTKEATKVESVKTKRFTVKDGKLEVLNTSKKEEADAKVKALQTELKPLILLIDNQEKKSTKYSKTINQKNYRIEAGNFETDTALPPVVETTETQE